MTEEVLTQEAPVETKAPKAKRVAAVLNLVLADGTSLKAGKYPMPVRAPRIPVTINGTECELAETAFQDKAYTYFTFGGAEFWIVGHIADKAQAFTFTFPEGYDFAPMKLDRKAQASVAAAKAKAKKAATAEQPLEGEERPLEGANAEGEGSDSPEASDAPTARAKKGKKASR